MQVLVSTSSFGKYDDTPLRKLKEAGIEVELNPHGRKLTEAEAKELIMGKTGLIAGTEPLTREVIYLAKALRVISRCGTGMDNVDTGAASERGILVYNTPDAVTPAVSELTLGLMLSCLRRIPQMHIRIKEGGWKKEMGHLLKGKTVGIIGMGRIGREVARLTSAFGANTLYYDVSDVSCPVNARCLGLDELLESSDIISLHAACSELRCPLIGAEKLGRMKKNALLINTSRGELVDEQALYEALKNGDILGAGIDVFREEPYTGPLKELDNVVLTSHVGSYAIEARVMMEIESADNLLKGLRENGLL